MKKTSYLMTAAVVIFFIAIVACTPQQEAATATPTETAPILTLTVSGSGSVTPVLTAIADEFEAANPGYLLEVLAGSGTGGGVSGAIDGTLDLAAMSRTANDDEAEQGIEFVQVGRSVTTIMTHPDLGVTELTSEQLVGVLTGAITNWSEVGGPDLDIVVYVRDPEESNTQDIREAFIGEAEFAASAQVLTSQTDMQNILSSVEGAVGYGTWTTAVATGADVVSLTIDGLGVDNSPDSLTGIIGLGYLSDRASDVQPLINWLLSDEGQSALETLGAALVTPE